MKHLLFLLFFMTSTLLIGQNIESFTYKVTKLDADLPTLKPVDHTVDPGGNIYALMMHYDQEISGNYTMVISKFHPQHGLQWNREIKLEEKDIWPTQISWSRLDELLILGELASKPDEKPSTYFARMSSQGNLLLDREYNENAEGGALSILKMDELATGDILLQVQESNVGQTPPQANLAHGLIRIDYQGQIQDRTFLPLGLQIIDFHITQNNEVFVAATQVEQYDRYFIFQFDYSMQLMASREFKSPNGSDLHPIRLSENSSAQPVIWLDYFDGWGIHHATFDMNSNGPFPSYSLLQQEDILLSDHISNNGNVIVGGRDANGARFYQQNNQGGVSQVLLETSPVINQGRTLQSYEVSADNRIVALLSDPIASFVDTFIIASSKMDFKVGCDLVDSDYEYYIENSIQSETIDLNLITIPIVKTTPETYVEEVEVIWLEKCRSNCPEVPIPSINISPLSNWRYSFEASGQLDPSITGFYWSVNGQVVGTGPAWEHTFDTPGQYRVCLTITTACGSKIVCSTVFIPASRLQPQEPKTRVKAWPNPVIDQLHVDIQQSKIETIHVFNHLGQQIELPWTQESDVRITVQTSRLPSGQYFLSIIDQNGSSESLKFVK